MGSIVTSLTGGVGGNVGAAGVNFEGAKAPIDTPVSNELAQNMNTGATKRIWKADELVGALQAQNGIGNQSQVYNQLQNVAAGNGPNPAQAQLANATGANVANQAALMAGQRGASANTGMIARQAAMQGANTQQQAAGQAAALQAQQSLGAIGQAGNLATNQVNQQAAATNADIQASQNMAQILNNQVSAQNNARIGMTSNLNNTGAGIANTVANAQMGLVSGVGQAAGQAAMMAAMARGGEVPQYADGTVDVSSGEVQTANQPQSRFARALQGASQAQQTVPGDTSAQGKDPVFADMQKTGKAMGDGAAKGIGKLFSGGSQPPGMAMAGGPMDAGGGAGAATMVAAEGGEVPALVSPGEKYLSPQDVKQVERGANPMQVGKTVPGKPKVKGAKNSYANDTVPATLEEGGIVLPRSVTQSKHPHWAAHKFVSQLMAKRGKTLPPSKKK